MRKMKTLVMAFAMLGCTVGAWAQDDIIESKEDPALSFPDSKYSTNINDKFTAPALTAPDGVTVSYKSSNTDVATVNSTTGEVTFVANGIVTITATSEENSKYNAGEASYVLRIINSNVTEAKFDFTKPAIYGYDEPTTTEGTNLVEGDVIETEIVTITNIKNGSTAT